MHTVFIALRALLFMSGFVWLWYWIVRIVERFDASYGLALPDWTSPAGLLVLAAGASLALTCAGYFVVRGRGTPALFDAPHEFVASGPYRYVRNPMYIGGFLVLFGFGLVEQSGAIVMFCAIWFAFFQMFVIHVEEPGLRRRFGASYDDYCRTVPRWIPRSRSC